jgi:hypothetical protein
MRWASPLAREAVLSVGVASTLAATLAWVGPPGADLAAHVYQRAVFIQHGFVFWNNFWYSGRYSFITYSVLYYPLAALLGIRLLAVATIAMATLAFAVIVWREWGWRARWSSRSFAVVWSGIVLSAAFPFALGAALAMLAIWAAQARRHWRFAALAALTLAGSPVAFLLLTLILLGVAIGRRHDYRLLATVGAVLAAVWLVELVVFLVFPGGGRYPFSAEELAAASVFGALGTVLAWRVAPAIRWIFPIYGAACLASFVVPSQIGENIVRLRYAAVPVALLVLALRDWRPRPVVVITLALALAWNLSPLAASFAQDSTDPTAAASYWLPAVTFLHRHLTPSYRVEVVDTTGHWAANYLPQAGIPLARGWFRQDDFPQNKLLYGPLGSRAYLAWLHRLAVRYVVLTDAQPDYSARAEAALIRSPHSPVRAVLRAPHLTVFAVPHATPLISGPAKARVLALTQSGVLLEVKRPGTYRLALRYSPYWRLSRGCLTQGEDGMISLVLRRTGTFRARFEFTAEAAVNSVTGAHPLRCAR